MGKVNDYGHPSPQTLALLARLGIPLLRTDRDGTVTIESDGKNWRVVSHQIARGDRPRPRLGRTNRVAEPKPSGRRINVNTATLAELEALPGVGPVIARRIVEGRPYRSVDDLARVKGIGKKRLEEIRPLVTAD